MLVHAFYPVHKFHSPASAFPQVPQVLCAHKHITGASTHPAPCQQTCIQSSCAPSHMPPQGGSNIQTSGSQSVVMSPKPKLFHDHTRPICALFTLILSRVYSGVFQRLCDMWWHHWSDGNGLCTCVPCFKNFLLSISKTLSNYRYNPQKHEQKLFEVFSKFSECKQVLRLSFENC